MAEGLMRHLYGHSVYVASCGVVTGEPDPFVAAVMDEIGIDINRFSPKTFEELEDTSFDLVISLSPRAHHKAIEMTRTMAIDVEYWPAADPSVTTGSREQILEAYRNVRDAIFARLKQRFGTLAAGGV